MSGLNPDDVREIVRQTVAETAKKRRNDRGNGSPALANAMRNILGYVEQTPTEFAKEIGRDPSLIQKILRGDRGLSIETLARIDQTYHLTDRDPGLVEDVLRSVWATDEASR